MTVLLSRLVLGQWLHRCPNHDLSASRICDPLIAVLCCILLLLLRLMLILIGLLLRSGSIVLRQTYLWLPKLLTWLTTRQSWGWCRCIGWESRLNGCIGHAVLAMHWR